MRNPTSGSYPAGGEIDILEGANAQNGNHFSYRTGSGCTQTNQTQSGWVETSNCDVNATGQTAGAGCGGWGHDTSSFGWYANNGGGGVYAMDWRPQGIRTWFFPRNAIPADITAGAPTTANWGTVMLLLRAR
jgi:hypothetical protein